ncbi:MAG: hypothetical protein ACI9MC_001755 [Kiritimatiellia bacterium]|jgi:hypothetical protein
MFLRTIPVRHAVSLREFESASRRRRCSRTGGSSRIPSTSGCSVAHRRRTNCHAGAVPVRSPTPEQTRPHQRPNRFMRHVIHNPRA